jgi:hypothetical protein
MNATSASWAARLGHDVEIERQARISIGGERHSADDGDTEAALGEEPADDLQLAREVHAGIVA